MLAIIDSKAMAYLELHAHKPTVNLFDTVCNCLLDIERSGVSITEIAFAYDIGKSSYRLTIWPKYKGTRTYTTVPDTFKSTYEVIVPKIAINLGITNYLPAEVEADDIAGVLCSKIQKDIVLLTVDHDWHSLVLRHEHVKMYDIKKRVLLNRAAIVAHTGCVTEEQFLTKKCVLGDAGDNILKVPTIGPIKYKQWADTVFPNVHPSDIAALKNAFIQLCDGLKTPQKIPIGYQEVGISTPDGLFDFNMCLGTIMRDLSLLSVEQKVGIKQAYLTRSTASFNLEEAQRIVSEHSEGHLSPFGDPYHLSPVSTAYYEEVYNRRNNTSNP